MVRTRLPLAFLLLLLAGIAIFILSSDVAPPSDGDHDPNLAEEVQGAVGVITAAPTVKKPSGVEIAPQRTTISTSNGKNAIDYGEEAGEGLLVVVVDGNTKKPLPFAEVMVIDTGIADMRMLEAELANRPDFDSVFEKLGVVYKTGSDAKVRVPFAIGANIIAGRTATHFNFSFNVDEDLEEFTLYLNPVDILTVQVVNKSEGPVQGAPVSLRVRNGDHVQDLMTAYTDQDGFASLKLFQLLQIELADDPTFVALLALTPQPVEAAIDVKDLPETPPVLVFNEMGQVQVHVLEADGNPTTGTFLVNVELLRPEDVYQSSDEFESWNNPREHLTKRTTQGIAEFPLIAYGQRLHISVTSNDGERRAEAFGEGPVVHGKPIVFTLTPIISHPILVGRILNTEGVIGPNLNLDYRINVDSPGGDRSNRSASFRTDENGRFRLLVEDFYEEESLRTLSITMKPTKRKPRRTVKSDLSFHLSPGENDLGDLVLQVPPLLVSGKILDNSGIPIRKAKVNLEVKHQYGEGENDFWWNGLWEFRTESDRDGAFSIRGYVESGAYRIKASKDSYRAGSLGFVLGKEGLELRLDRSVQVRGSFLLDAKIDATKLTASLSFPSPNPAGGTTSLGSELAEDGSYRIDNLPAGYADLSLTSEFQTQELFRQDHILLSNSQLTQTLDVIDLRSTLQVIRLWVKNIQGEVLNQVKVWPAGSNWKRIASTSPIDIITREPAIDLMIGAAGYQSVKLNQVVGEQEVILGLGFPIRLDLNNPNVIPDGWNLYAWISPIDLNDRGETDRRYTNQISHFGAEASPKTLQAYGTYRVNFSIQKQASSSGIHYDRKGIQAEQTSMEVKNLPSLQVFSFTLEQSSIAKAMEENESEG